MNSIKNRLDRLKGNALDRIAQAKLDEFGLRGITLRPYQLDGVTFLRRSYDDRHGCILGDEMGLGKTIQVISTLLHLKGSKDVQGPFLILCPLSVLSNWGSEFERFTRDLKVVSLFGDKDKREEIKHSIKCQIHKQDVNRKMPAINVVLTTYEICIREVAFLRNFHWKALIVDEAHRLKNSKSLLHQELSQFNKDFIVLLTGTPVQNNLNELYSLLSFVAPSIFDPDLEEAFLETFADVETSSGRNSDLQYLLSPFLLRRVKLEVMSDLPQKSEVILYTGMTELQKKYYKAILTKDLGAFSNESSNKSQLKNTLVHLRKCVNHPYLFDGVEPEPFVLGDHLINASGKLQLLDQLLSFLHKRNHKVLVFSQMTRVLDILQDYLGYRGFTYERLDGSVRGEERYLAIRNFNETEDTFVFLLSTKAGGQGLNLTSADTVIFFSSITPEMNQILEGNLQLSDILKFGLDKLFDSEEKIITEKDYERILGKSANGEWVVEDEREAEENEEEEEEMEVEENEPNQVESMYVYEGHDYSKENIERDKAAFDKMVADMLEEVTSSERARRTVARFQPLSFDLPTRKRKVLTPEELKERRKKREEDAAKRAKLKEQKEQMKEEARKRKLETLWRENDYISLNITLNEKEEKEEEEEEEMSDEEEEEDKLDIQYVNGDVTQPINATGNPTIIVHTVDDSGYWGSGGVFTAISRRSKKPEEHYELAGEMKDLHLGDAHLIPFAEDDQKDSNSYLSLIVAQSRDRHHRLLPMNLSALSEGLERVSQAAKDLKASVHLPRIGHSTPSFNWYGTERLIRKHLAATGIPTFIYYFPRKQSSSTSRPSTSSTVNTSDKIDISTTRPHRSQDEPTPKKNKKDSLPRPLPDFFSGVRVFFDDVPKDRVKLLSRYVIAYDGDVQSYMDENITHVICSNEDSKLTDIPSQGTNIVTAKWLEDSIKKQRLLDTTIYSINTL
ncbi:chromodomain-helicase-DNA-binding protein 1-like [Actinia tenebrosa]|uniref:Chromodomain-helicase-DNA-binding protein 1-like n=1 Tax=Actinia tenebrosa TaxID=6105 RepID=A0A6P8HXZ9_ACTTE|nr:chromodomain-helicase-DNA-binding protein 1-like [Actinia tenebrosa]